MSRHRRSHSDSAPRGGWSSSRSALGSNKAVARMVGSITVLALLLVGGAGAVEITAIRSRADVDAMLVNALPSTDLLNQTSDDLRDVDSALDRAITRARQAPADWGNVRDARLRAGKAFATYQSLPSYPGEGVLQDRVEAALQEFDAVLARIEQAVGQNNLDAANALDETDWRTAKDNVEAQVRVLTLLNVRHAVMHAQSLDALWQRLAAITGALALTLLVLGGSSIWISASAVARQIDFEESRSAELEMYAGRVAHDILSPLASTHMALRVLSKVEEPKLASAVRSAIDSLTRSRQVVDGLLSFATSGGGARRGQRTAVPRALLEARSELTPEALAARVELDCHPPDLCEVACGPEILSIILSNLVRNAIKFMGESPTRRVTLSAVPGSAEVRFQVEDTGPGLPVGFEKLAFLPYSRGQDDRPGLGLGLATVKRLVEAYGGRVGVDSRPGSGATFWFVIPRAVGFASAGVSAVA